MAQLGPVSSNRTCRAAATGSAASGARPPSVNSTRSVGRSGVANPLPSRIASVRSASAPVSSRLAKASTTSSDCREKAVTTRGRAPASTTETNCSPDISPAQPSASSRARSNRPSIPMEPETSNTSTVWAPSRASSEPKGRAREKTKAARTASCNSSSGVIFSRLHGREEESGSPAVSQRSRLETSTLSRRLRNMYRAIRGRASDDSPRAAGTRKLKALLPPGHAALPHPKSRPEIPSARPLTRENRRLTREKRRSTPHLKGPPPPPPFRWSGHAGAVAGKGRLRGF